jgi:hypothetical protein
VVVAVLASGCTMANQDDGTSGDAGNTCDGKNDCGACSECASQVLCAELLSTCVNNAACNGLDVCVTNCGADLDCKQDCVAANPNGAADYEAATRCVYCQECPVDCAGYRVCD